MGSIWDKRYRLKTLPILNNGTYTKIQGAIVQLIYRNLIEGNLSSVYDDVHELLKLLCNGPNAVKPILPVSKQQELLDEIQIFVENNELYIKGNRTNDLKRVFFDFAFEFLRLESVVRIFPLSGVNTKMTLEPLTKKKYAPFSGGKVKSRLALHDIFICLKNAILLERTSGHYPLLMLNTSMQSMAVFFLDMLNVTVMISAMQMPFRI